MSWLSRTLRNNGDPLGLGQALYIAEILTGTDDDEQDHETEDRTRRNR